MNGSPANTEPADRKRQPPWKVALLVVSSVFLSGIAVVLWNRTSLGDIRSAPNTEPQSREDEFI